MLNGKMVSAKEPVVSVCVCVCVCVCVRTSLYVRDTLRGYEHDDGQVKASLNHKQDEGN